MRFLYRADDSTYCYLLGHWEDPDTIGNCIRAFTQTKPIWPSTFDNIHPESGAINHKDGWDDLFISMLEGEGNYNDEYVNGWSFSFPMYKGRGFWQEWGLQESYDSEEVDGTTGATTGFWNVGDSVILKWSSWDRSSWDFWYSLAFNNPSPAVGGGDGDTTEDIRLNTVAQYPTQLRTVTKDDYMIRAMSLPSQFGVVYKAYITQENEQISDRIPVYDENNTNALCLHILSKDSEGKLANCDPALKQNLVTYLAEYRMLTDSVNVKDAFIINIGIKTITVVKEDTKIAGQTCEAPINADSKLVLPVCLNLKIFIFLIWLRGLHFLEASRKISITNR